MSDDDASRIHHWNVRLLRSRVNGTPVEVVEWEFHFHEVVYDEHGEILGWTETPTTPWGESPREARLSVERYLQACEKPVLTEGLVEGKHVLLEVAP